MARHQLTGNAGLYHAAWQLSRRGWHVMPTVRNAQGSDLYAASQDESIVLTIQSKALSNRNPVPLGRSLEALRSAWWIITVNANSEAPTSYVLTIDEVRQAAHHGVATANPAQFWLQPKGYDRAEFREAWDRLGSPA